MQIQHTIHSLVGEVSTSLVESLKDLQNKSKIIHHQEQSKKIKTIFGMLEDQNMEELENELNEFEDPYLNNIAKTLLDKLRHDKSIHALSLQEIKTKKEITPQKKETKPKTNHGNSLIKGMLGKFMKTEKDNARPMILPDKEPKCYYDPVKRKYVIEGEEEEEVKEIPKPPPATKMMNGVNGVNGGIGNKDKKKNQIDDLMAPPAYKRKGAKKKEENVQHKPKQISFESLEEKIVLDLQNVEDRILKSIECLAPKEDKLSVEKYQELANIGDEVRVAQEVSDTLLTRLFSSNIDSQFDDEVNNKIHEKLVKLELSNEKILGLALKAKGTYETQFCSEKSIMEEEKKTLCERLMQYEEEICILKLESNKLNEELESKRKALIDEREKFKLNLESEVSENLMIKHALTEKKETIQNLQIKNTQLEEQIKSIQSQNKLLNQKMTNFEKNIYEEQKAITNKILEKSNQLALMDLANWGIKSVDQLDLDFTNQSKTMILNNEEKEENNVLSCRQENPLSLLELSHYFNTLIQHYENALKTIKRENTFLAEKNDLAKAEQNRIQQSLQNENICLSRSITRIKSLMEKCKEEKEEYEIKVTQLQIENEKIQKQLTHIREEHNKTKDILDQHIREAHNCIVLVKEELEAEKKYLQEELQQKDIAKKATETQLEESNNLINELIKKEKNRTVRIEELSGELKGMGEKLDESCAEGIRLKSKIWDLENEIKEMVCFFEEEKIRTDNDLSHITNKFCMVEQELKSSLCELSTLKEEKESMKLGMIESRLCKEKLKGEVDDLKNMMVAKEEEMKSVNWKQNELIRELEENKETREKYLAEIEETHNKEIEEQLTQITELIAELKEYQVANTEQAQNIISLSSNAANLKQEWEATQLIYFHKIEELTNLLNDNQVETERLNKQVIEFESMMHDLTVKLDEMEEKSKTGELEAEIESLKQEHRQIMEENQRAHEEEIQQIADKLEETKNRLTFSQNEINSNLQIISEKEQKCEELISRMDKIQTEYDKVKEEMGGLEVNYKKELFDNKEELQKCQEEMEELRIVCVDKDKQIERCNDKIKELSEQNANYLLVESELNNKIQSLSESHHRQISEREEIISQRNQFPEQQYRVEEMVNEETQTQNVECSEEMENKSEKVEEESECLVEAKQKLEAAILEIKELSINVNYYEEEIKRLNEQVFVLGSLNHKPQEEEPKQGGYQEEGEEGEQEEGEQEYAKEKESHSMNSKSEQNDELNEEVSKLNLKIISLEERLAQKENDLIEVNRHNEILNEEIEALIAQQQKNESEILLQSQNKSPPIYYNSIQSQVSSFHNHKSEQTTENEKGSEGNNNFNEYGEGVSKEQKELELLVSTQDSSISEQNLLIEQLNLDIERGSDLLRERNEKVTSLEKEKSELHEFYHKKLNTAEETIEKLEKQVFKLEHVDKDYQTALNQIQTLEKQSEKLLRDNDNLIKTKDEILTKLIQYQSCTQEGLTEKEYSQLKVEQNNDEIRKVEIKNEAALKSNSFFESLSSLFLTPSETNKLSLNGK